MAKIKKLLALGLCLCMAAGITVGCGNSKSSKNSTDSGKNTNDGLSFAFCTNTLNNTFQSSIDSKLKELCDKDGISYTCLDPDYDLNKQLSQLSDVANNGYDAVFVIPVDSAGITSGLAEISEAGIPIFNVDTAVIDDDLESFVRIGRIMDQYIHRGIQIVRNVRKCTRWEVTGICLTQDFQSL